MKAILNGDLLQTNKDVHETLQHQLGFPDYYGKNFSALRDCLSTDVERPIEIEWRHWKKSKSSWAIDFKKFIEIFTDIQEYDMKYPEGQRFTYRLVD